MNPLTWIVLLITGIFLIYGGVLIGGANAGERDSVVCPQEGCGGRNSKKAKFCSHCGRPLTPPTK